MVRRQESRHARPSGRAAVAAAYDRVQGELTAVRSQHWTDQLEMIRLASLTRELTAQVTALQTELGTLREELQAARSTPPVVVEVPAAGWSSVAPPAAWAASAPPGWAPAQQPAWAPQPYAAPPEAWVPQAAMAQQPAVREDLLLQEMAELRRLVAHQQTLLADLTVRLLDLLARFIPVAPAPPAYAAPPQPQPYPAPQPGQPAAPQQPAAAYTPPATLYQAPDDLVMDDETASRLRVIREAFGR